MSAWGSISRPIKTSSCRQSPFPSIQTRWQDEESALKFRDAIPEHPYQWHFPYESASTTIRLLRGTSTEAINRQDPFAQ